MRVQDLAAFGATQNATVAAVRACADQVCVTLAVEDYVEALRAQYHAYPALAQAQLVSGAQISFMQALAGASVQQLARVGLAWDYALGRKADPERLFRDVRCRSYPGDAAGNGSSCTDYDFTDYDLYGMALGWWSMEERKGYCGPAGDYNKVVDEDVAALYNQAAAQEVPFCRENPKNWFAELLVELSFMRALEAISTLKEGDPRLVAADGKPISNTGMMILQMNKMIQYKAGLKDQWVLQVPGLLEVTSGGDINGRHRYAVARAGYAPIYFYVLAKEAWRYKRGDGSLNFSTMAGRTYTEANYQGRYVPKADPAAEQVVMAAAEVIASGKNISQGQGPSISSIANLVNLFADADKGPIRLQAPLNLVEPPLSTEQEILTGIKTTAMAIAQYAQLLYGLVSFASKGGDGTSIVNTNPIDAVLKLAMTGNVGTAIDGGQITQLAGQVTTMIVATEGVFYTSLTNQMLSNALDAVTFSSEWAEIYAAAAEQARAIEAERARLVREQYERDNPGATPPGATAQTAAASSSGGLMSLLAGAAAGFLVGNAPGAVVGALVASATSGSGSKSSAAPAAAPPATVSDWVGTWDTSNGVMKLQQSGRAIVGTYEYQQGAVAGVVLPTGEISLKWAQTGPSDGTMTGRLAPDGKSFLGTWKVTGSTNNGVWHGTKRS
ncbi:MAG: hypothetical protein KJ648_07410 [Candidatus Omnitrophica bacterium]|nr:hypothetical protein [Candidatus Omnitrophota bacterium]